MQGKKNRIDVAAKIVRRSKSRQGEVYVQWTWTHPEKGPQTETGGWLRQADVEAERRRVEARETLGLPIESLDGRASARTTIGDLIGKYADDVEERGVGCNGYRTNIENRSVPLTLHLGRTLVSRLSVDDLDAYIAKRRTEVGGRRKNRTPKRTTVQDELRLLRRVWAKAKKTGLHDREWPGMPSLKGWPDDSKPPRKLSEEEVARLASTAASDRPSLARFLQFLAHCPRRPIAYADLRRGGVKRALDSGYAGNDLAYFEKDKGGVGRGWGPLLPEARAALTEHLKDTIGPDDGLVWTSPQGSTWTANKINSMLRYLCLKAEVAATTAYDLRKYAAVVAYRRCDRSLKATMRFTGHKDAMTLLRHYLFDEDDLVAAAVAGTPSLSRAKD